jgi:hypothetical protein
MFAGNGAKKKASTLLQAETPNAAFPDAIRPLLRHLLNHFLRDPFFVFVECEWKTMDERGFLCF